jgi:hypothetical protein
MVAAGLKLSGVFHRWLHLSGAHLGYHGLAVPVWCHALDFSGNNCLRNLPHCGRVTCAMCACVSQRDSIGLHNVKNVAVLEGE